MVAAADPPRPAPVRPARDPLGHGRGAVRVHVLLTLHLPGRAGPARLAGLLPEQVQSHAVEGELGGAAADLGTGAGPAIAVGGGPAVPGEEAWPTQPIPTLPPLSQISTFL